MTPLTRSAGHTLHTGDETMMTHQHAPGRYCAACPTKPDTCPCGQPTVTEVQIGWDADLNRGAGGGIYDVMCEGCYQQHLDREDEVAALRLRK